MASIPISKKSEDGDKNSTRGGATLTIPSAHFDGSLSATVKDSTGQKAKVDASKATVGKDAKFQLESSFSEASIQKISHETSQKKVGSSEIKEKIESIHEISKGSGVHPLIAFHAEGAFFGGDFLIYANISNPRVSRECTLLKQLERGEKIVWSREGGLPRQDIQFVGREVLLVRLESELTFEKVKDSKEKQHNSTLNSVIACSGLSGIGKTQLAKKYIRDSKNNYTARIWFSANNKEVFGQCCMELAIDLGYSNGPSEKGPQRYLNQLIAKYPGWLFIYDNMNDFNDINFLPEQGAYVLLTTHLRDLPPRFKILEIEEMTEEESIQLIESWIAGKIEGKENEESRILVKLLGYLPLALAQVGAYLKNTNMSFANYRINYKNQEAFLLAIHILKTNFYIISVIKNQFGHKMIHYSLMKQKSLLYLLLMCSCMTIVIRHYKM